MARSSRRGVGVATLLTASLLASIGAAEIAVRLAGPRVVGFSGSAPRPPPARPAGGAASADLPELETVVELARPLVRGLHKGLPFRTNSRGLRGGEYTRFPASGVVRILVAGDSVTMGSGVREEEAYPARLEALLEAAEGGVDYEVLNLGLSGLSLEHVVRRIARVGLYYHPRLIVYGFTLNDIEGPAYRRTATEERTRVGVGRYLRFADAPLHLLRVAWPRALALWDLLRVPYGSLAYDVRQNYFHNPEAWSAFVGHLDDLAALGARTQTCVHVFIHSVLLQLDWLHPYRKVYDRVEKAARDRGMTVTQSFPTLRGRRSADLVVEVFKDPHPNALGHELLARALHDGLGELPGHCLDRSRSAP